MTNRHIFHLSIPVADLAAATHFYTSVLGAKVGRREESWLDVLVWGHQITLQLRPSDVVSLASQGKRHFGVVLPWSEWEALAAQLSATGVSFLEPPEVLFRGKTNEQGKFYLADPSNNIIEVKTYRDPSATIGRGDDAYRYPDV